MNIVALKLNEFCFYYGRFSSLLFIKGWGVDPGWYPLSGNNPLNSTCRFPCTWPINEDYSHNMKSTLERHWEGGGCWKTTGGRWSEVGGAPPPAPAPTPLDLRDNSCNTGGLRDWSHYQLGEIEMRRLMKNLRSWEFINLYVRRTADVLVATPSGQWHWWCWAEEIPFLNCLLALSLFCNSNHNHFIYIGKTPICFWYICSLYWWWQKCGWMVNYIHIIQRYIIF